MQPPKPKDYYSILGVDPNASAEDLREAYRFLTRVIHPDRFDPSQRSKDWRQANARMSAINEAYTVLNDPAQRKTYDASRSNCGPAITNQEAAESARGTAEPGAYGKPITPRAYQMETLTPGTAIYGELPRVAQEILRRRQANIGQDQIQIPLHSIRWNYCYLVLLTGFFGVIFYDALRSPWPTNWFFSTGGISLVAGLLMGGNIVTLLKWHKSALKPFFYLTPIYLIKTEYNNIAFLPLWKLQNNQVRHRYFCGLYCGTTVSLRVDGIDEVLKFHSPADWEQFHEQLLVYREKLRVELVDNNHAYLREHDDFREVRRHAGLRRVRLKRSKCFLVYVMSGAFSVILWATSALLNIISHQ